MNEILQGKGLVRVLEDKVFVTGLRGPFEEGWQLKVKAFVARLLILKTAPSRRAPPRSRTGEGDSPHTNTVNE
jgi:hypothetical protein